MEDVVSILREKKAISRVSLLDGGFVVGERDVTSIVPFQENGGGGRDTGDIWVVVISGNDRVTHRVLASRCIIEYGEERALPVR